MLTSGGVRLYKVNELWYVETTTTEAYETPTEASKRLNELIGVFGLCHDEEVPEPEPEPAAGDKLRKRWSEEECAVIAGASSPTDAAQKYREAFPDSPRTDYAAVQKYGKMKQQQPGVATPHEPVEPELPERGATVRITGQVGRASGKVGSVIRRDTVVGEVLVHAGNDGCFWLKPEDVEVVE